MAKSKAETKLEEAIANAAEQQAKATDVDEATRWQGIVNQSVAAIERLREGA